MRAVPAGRKDDLSMIMNRVYVVIILLPLLATCGQPEEDDASYVVTIEEFSPENLSDIERIFAFESDGVGYAASVVLTERDGRYYRENYVLSKTEDRGRTWTPVWKGKGECTTVSIYGDYLYYVTHISEDSNTTYSEIWRTGRDRIKPELMSRFDYGIYGFHVFNDSTYTYGYHKDDNTPLGKDTLKISNDFGKTWRNIEMPADFSGISGLAYSKDVIYASVSDDKGIFLYRKDIVPGEDKLFPSKFMYSMQASDNLFTTYPDMAFWEYDDRTMEIISSFRWNRGYGPYHPANMFKKGDLVICVASQYPGEVGKKQCIFGSIDGGYHWKPFLMGDDIRTNILYEQGKIAAIPDKDVVSIIFGRGGSNLHILTLKKKQE